MSQTTKCTTYVFERNSQVYAFIDTPGLSDTRGVEQDDANIQTILRAAGEAKSLRAIVLIINGSASRITLNVKNALERMAGNLPDVLLNNLIVIFTHCSNCSKNFDESSLPILPAKSVAMDNSAFSTPPANWNPRDIRQVQFSWDSSMELIQEIITFIDELAPQSTQAFTQMLDNRERIRLNIDEAVQQVIEQNLIHQRLKEVEVKEEKLNCVIQMHQLDYQHVCAEMASVETCLIQLKSRIESQEQIIAQYRQQQQLLHSNSIQRSTSFLQALTQMNNSLNPHSDQSRLSLGVYQLYQDFSRQHINYQEDLQDIMNKSAINWHQHELTLIEGRNLAEKQILIYSRQRLIMAQRNLEKRAMNDLQKEKTRLYSQIKVTEIRIQSEMATVQRECRELKTMCSKFDFVQELHSKKTILQEHKSTLRDVQKIQDIDALLHQLDQLALELTSN